MKKQILAVENDQTIYQSFQNWMQSEDIEVSCVLSAVEALESVLKYEYCLVVLSLQFTEASDMELLRMIRNSKRMPIIVLTDRLTTSDKVSIFQAGANAYVERPIDFPICIAQATSLIHLFLEAQNENKMCLPLIFGSELLIDTTYRQVIIDGELLTLTCKEFELLVCLAKHPCQIWSRAQLYRYVWHDDLGINGDNTMKTHIGNLKLHPASATQSPRLPAGRGQMKGGEPSFPARQSDHIKGTSDTWAAVRRWQRRRRGRHRKHPYRRVKGRCWGNGLGSLVT